MLRYVALTGALMALSGCIYDDPVYRPDDAVRQELFFKCLSMATAGWHAFTAAGKAGSGDIVRACGDEAYLMSKRCVKNCEVE